MSSDDEPPKIVLGKILRVGSSVDAAIIGQSAAAYTKQVCSTLVRTTEYICVSAADFEVTSLAATLPNLCRAVNCLKAGNVEPDQHILVLPAPLPIVSAFTSLSRALNFRVTLVMETREDKEECLLKFHMPSKSIILAEDTGELCSLMIGTPPSAPSTVIASEFSPLSHEVWRFMPPMSRFILSEGSVDVRPDALPFTKGASFIPTSIGSLYRQSQASAILKSALAILVLNKELLLQEPMAHDIGTLSDTKRIPSPSAKMDHNVVTFSYGESSVKVCIHLRQDKSPC